MHESICVLDANKASSTNSALFDARVAAIRARGIAPKHKPYGKHKADCTAEEWAAHREYMRCRYANPRCREMHIANQIKYLAGRR